MASRNNNDDSIDWALLRFGKISIVFEDLSKNSVFFRTEVKDVQNEDGMRVSL